MKTKYFLLYIFVGIAFLAVSAWVFFSRGKNAKAIRAKYKLGGIMLMCMAMLSVASCGEILNPGEVMCYDPPPDYSFTVSTGKHDANWQYILSPGDVLKVQVECRRYEKYGIVIRRFEDMKEGDVLQSAFFESEGKDQFQYELPYDPADKAYAGIARVDIYGYPEGKEDGNQLYSTILLVTTRAD
jgi:hypothetical protein